MFFGIAPVDGQSLSVDQFDVTVWNLQGLAGRQALVVDLFIAVTAIEKVSQIDLVLPFAVDRSKRVDIADRPADPSLTTLGFKSIERTADEKSNGFKLSHVSNPGIRVPVVRLKGESNKQECVESKYRGFLVRRSRVEWCSTNLLFDQSILPGGQGILRVRYVLRGQTSAVYWKRSGFGINGGLFDLRLFLPDRRIYGGSGSEPILERCVMPKSSTITCIVRATWKVQFSDPRDMEAALLERGKYNEYLKRVPDLRNQGALVSYRVECVRKTADIEDGEALREYLFLNVAREFGLMPIGNYLRILLTALIALVFVDWVEEFVAISLRWAVSLLASFGLVGVLYLLLSKISLVKSWWTCVQDAYYRVEDWIFETLDKQG